MSTRGLDNSEPLLTPAEVAGMFRVDVKTVSRWALAGKISSIRTLGGHRRFRESEVKALLNRVVQVVEQFRVSYWVPDEAAGRVPAVYGVGGYEARIAAVSALRRAVREGHDAWLERWDSDTGRWDRVGSDA